MELNARHTRLTLLDLITTVRGLTDDDEEAAEVINHMLRSEHIRFVSEPPREELRQLLQ